ncbi:MAG TPA: rhodanese-like domain-containing protein [Thermodesulfovibrionales bacterium]|nr:rhodanese-like domain-containing protein [Thermodesulfovibrionales bacterium]
MKLKWITLLLSLLLTSSYVAAQEFKNVTTDELKKMIDGKEKMVLVDARGEWDYKNGHIPTAINIPPDKNAVIQEYLPSDKEVLLIFYCLGGGS